MPLEQNLKLLAYCFPPRPPEPSARRPTAHGPGPPPVFSIPPPLPDFPHSHHLPALLSHSVFFSLPLSVSYAPPPPSVSFPLLLFSTLLPPEAVSPLPSYPPPPC